MSGSRCCRPAQRRRQRPCTWLTGKPAAGSWLGRSVGLLPADDKKPVVLLRVDSDNPELGRPDYRNFYSPAAGVIKDGARRAVAIAHIGFDKNAGPRGVRHRVHAIDAGGQLPSGSPMPRRREANQCPWRKPKVLAIAAEHSEQSTYRPRHV